MTFTILIAFMTVCIPSIVEAQHGGCMMGQKQAGPAVAPETMQKFNKETKALREQLIDKEALLKKEFLKDDPSPDTIATIKKAIIDIQRDIQKVAKKLGMKNWYCTCHMLQGSGCGGGCGGGMHMCGKK